jgi:hypothetical protein
MRNEGAILRIQEPEGILLRVAGSDVLRVTGQIPHRYS